MVEDVVVRRVRRPREDVAEVLRNAAVANVEDGRRRRRVAVRV